MTRPGFATLSLVAVIGVASAADQGGAPDPLPEKTAKATFAFAGTVKKAKSSNVKQFAAGENTAVVTVNHVLKSSKALSQVGGKDITVLCEGAAPEEGKRFYFFTQAVGYGTSMAVKEVAAREAAAVMVEAPGVKGMASQVLESVARQADDDLKQHVGRAEAVVFGTVDEVKRIERRRLTADQDPGHPPRPSVTEHYPQWHVARVEVVFLLKGDPGLKKIGVIFAMSPDVAWYSAPKFSRGQVGTFLLHDDQVKDAELREALTREARRLLPEVDAVHFALDPGDFQPKQPDDSNVQRLRRLIKD